MKKIISAVVCLFFSFILLTSCEKTITVANYAIIPLPQNMEKKEGSAFELSKDTKIVYPQGNEKLKRTAEFLSEYLEFSTGMKLSVTDKEQSGNTVVLRMDFTNDNKEAYNMLVTDTQVTINGTSEAGVFYGVQTLRKSIAADSDGAQILLPQVNITDYPRFGYRGAMLDTGRYFFSLEFIKKYIDVLALHNINYFHWHLTEDQGWRLEIKKYPKLTEIGSQRKETAVGRNESYDGKPYGGFYTQDEAKEIIAYAQERFITVIPEIDLPGHMQAALASYPELGCTGGPYEVGTRWDVYDEVLCLGNDNTFAFLDDVLSEVVEIFPSEYIHIGGDECPKKRWQKCPKCQAKIKSLGLKADKSHSAEDKLQSYCINHVEKFLNGKNRKIIGWDEILEGGLAPNATVMSWRGMQGGITSAKQKHDVIMAPTSHAYFDYYQAIDRSTEPLAMGGYTPLEKVYAFEPVPTELNDDEKKYIIGVQANLWTEYISTPEHAEYMLLPRLDAMAEVQWTMPEKRSYDSFMTRIGTMLKFYDKAGYSYGATILDVKGELTPNIEEGSIKVVLSTFDNAPIHYTLDGMKPGSKSELYTEPLIISKSENLNAVAIRKSGDSRIYSRKFDFNKATLKPIEVKAIQNTEYTFGGAQALVDGITGGNDYMYGSWLGFLGEYVDAVIDLKESTSISSVKVGTYLNVNDWIFGATGLTVSVSEDGKKYKQVAKNSYFEAPETQKDGRINIEAQCKDAKGRYVKIEIAKTKKLPDWHWGKGSVPYLFIDEIQVN